MMAIYDELWLKKSMMALIGACGNGAQQCNNIRNFIYGIVKFNGDNKQSIQSLISFRELYKVLFLKKIYFSFFFFCLQVEFASRQISTITQIFDFLF